MTSDLEMWLAAVEKRFVWRYCVDLTDLGWDLRDKVRYFDDGWEPADFVRWFGEKYDLVERTSAYGLM